jgi:phage-related minor tail protein
MANGNNLELALRIKTDLQSGVQGLEALKQSVSDVGEVTQQTQGELDAQTQRLRAMVAASLEAKRAQDALSTSVAQQGDAIRLAGSNWQDTARAQSDAMNAYHNAERATRLQAQAQQEATVQASKVASATNAQTAAMRTAGLTAGQYQQAMRMLPMQLTDVVTSLSTGMPVWMVAIQQGGQIRDSFNGIGPAARAVISAINPMTAAIAAAVGVAATLAIAYRQGAQEAVAYRDAIILTGNAVGLTSDQLAGMASRIDQVSGTQRQAAAALAEIASNGQFAGSQVEAIGTAAVAMENATGKAVSDTVAEFAKLAKEPAKASAELNQRYNYLTASIYEQIQALEQQGNTTASAQLAIDTYSQTIIQRSAQVEGNLQGMDRWWKSIKESAAEAWDAMVGIGREIPIDQQIADLDKRIAQAQSRSGRSLGNRFQPTADTTALESERNSKQLEREQAEGEARQRAALARYNQEAIATDRARQTAADTFVKTSESQLQSLQKLTDVERARQIMQKQGITENSTLGQSMLQAAQATDRQRASNEAATEAEREANKARREAEQAAKSAAREAEQLAKQQEHYVVGLERQAATLGKTSAETRAYDLAEKGLTGALLARAQAALAATDAQEQLRQATADGKQLAEIQAQILSAQGRGSEAAAIQMEQQYGELLKRLTARGDTAGVALVDSLVNTQVVKAKFDELQQQFDRVMNERSRREQSVQAQQQAGLIGESEARRQILQIYQETSGELDDLIAKMEALANASGNPELVEMVRRLRGELERSKQQVDEFAVALREGLTDGIQESFKGLIKGTMSFKESISNIFESIGDSLLNALSRRVADNSADTIMGILGFATGQQGQSAGNGIAAMAGQQVAAIQQVSMAQQAANTAMATSSVASANVAAAGQVTAAATTTTAWTPAAITASIGSFGAAAAIGLAAVIAAMAFKAFKDGGHVTGPGTGTSDSIPARLSNNEFVTRAAVVTQPGALDFLDDFNRRGMVALGDYGTANHSTGGLAGTPAPSYPAPVLPNGGQPADPSTNLSTTLKNSQNFYLVDDPARVRDAAWDDQGVERMYIAIQRDPQKFRNLINPRG